MAAVVVARQIGRPSFVSQLADQAIADFQLAAAAAALALPQDAVLQLVAAPGAAVAACANLAVLPTPVVSERELQLVSNGLPQSFMPSPVLHHSPGLIAVASHPAVHPDVDIMKLSEHMFKDVKRHLVSDTVMSAELGVSRRSINRRVPKLAATIVLADRSAASELQRMFIDAQGIECLHYVELSRADDSDVHPIS